MTGLSERRIHVVGARPVGLMLTALLQTMEGGFRPPKDLFETVDDTFATLEKLHIY